MPGRPGEVTAMSLPTGVNGNYVVVDYVMTNAALVVHLLNTNPGGGQPNDWYASFAHDEIAANTSQATLRNMLIERLKQSNGVGLTSLDTIISNGTVLNVT
jgi:hypothetical protein